MIRKGLGMLLALCLIASLCTGCSTGRVFAQVLPTLENEPLVTLRPKAEPSGTPIPTATPTVKPTATPTPTPSAEPSVTPSATPAPGELSAEEMASIVDDPQKSGLTCYLTFDDGPSKNTEAILKILEEKGVKATFFVIGDNAAAHPEKIKAIAAQGSCVANHTQTHKTDAIYKSKEALLKDLNAGKETLNSILGEDYPTDLMRFPYGSTNRRCRDYRDAVKDAGYRFFDWNALNGDAEHDAASRSANDLYKQLKETVRAQYDKGNNVIVLMHDTNSKGKTVEMLDDAIDYISSLGYTFDTLENKQMN